MDWDKITELRRLVRNGGPEAASARRKLLKMADITSMPVTYDQMTRLYTADNVNERRGRKEYRGMASLFDNARLKKH